MLITDEQDKNENANDQRQQINLKIKLFGLILNRFYFVIG